MLKNHGPGGCCCYGDVFYDWYIDSANSAGEDWFVRVPAVWPEEHVGSGSGLWWDSTDEDSPWQIDCIADQDKSIYSTCCPGHRTTTEYVISVETWVDSYYYVVIYDILGRELMDYYKCEFFDGYDDYEILTPSVDSVFQYGWADHLNGLQTGAGCSCGCDEDYVIRGIIDWTNTGYGIFTKFVYDISGESLTREVRTFDRDDFIAQAGDTIYDDGAGTLTAIEMIYEPRPQAMAPRYWPFCAGIELIYYIEGTVSPYDYDIFTTYPSARLIVGQVGCDDTPNYAGDDPGTLTFPVTDTETIVAVEDETDEGGLVACWAYQAQIGYRHAFDVKYIDASPGGYILLAFYRFADTTGDLEDPDDYLNFSVVDRYFVRLYVGGHGYDEPQPMAVGGTSPVEYEYEISSTDYGTYGFLPLLWGKPHAIHKHPTEDDYYLFAIPFREDVDSNYRINVYRVDSSTGVASLYWQSPIADTTDLPAITCSSDRWIYVESFDLSASDVEFVTRGLYDEIHGSWMISHNPETYPGEDPTPYYVPQGIRTIAGPPNAIIEKTIQDDYVYDTIKNSRNIPYAPPGTPF